MATSPIRHPVLDDNGLITPEWDTYLRTLGGNGGGGGASTTVTRTVLVGGGGGGTSVQVPDSDLLAQVPIIANGVLTTNAQKAIGWTETIQWSNLPLGVNAWNASPIIGGSLRVVGPVELNSPLSVTRITTPAEPTTNLVLNPTGDVVLDPMGRDVLPGTGYTVSLGSPAQKFLSLNAAELVVDSLVASAVESTIGGRVLVAPTTSLVKDLGSTSTDVLVYVKHNNMGVNDILRLEDRGQVEFLLVTTAPTPVSGGYVITVTRDYDGTSRNNWLAGDGVVNTRTAPALPTIYGFIDLYATNGILSGSGPTIVGNVRTGSAFNNIEPRWAIGNLNGLYGYGANVFGACFGDPAKSWVKIDDTNGVRLGNGGTTNVSITPDGNATFSGTITATAGNIGGWLIGASSLTDAAGVVGMSSAATGGDDIRFWAGSATPASAPWRVYESGAVVANNLFITPVAASGGGAYTNANAVRWTSDTTYRTAIWRSDDTSATAFKAWKFDNINWDSAGTVITDTYITTKEVATVTSGFGTATIWARAKSNDVGLQLWTGVTGGGQDAVVWMGTFSGGSTSGQVTIGVGTASTMNPSVHTPPTLVAGLDIWAGTVFLTGDFRVGARFYTSSGAMSTSMTPGSSLGQGHFLTWMNNVAGYPGNLYGHSFGGFDPNGVTGPTAAYAFELFHSYFTPLYVRFGATATTWTAWEQILTSGGPVVFNTDLNCKIEVDTPTRIKFTSSFGGLGRALGFDGNYLLPFQDGVINLGAGGNRWLTVYAITGAINTSDARLKTAITDSPYGSDFVRALRPIDYRWKDPAWGTGVYHGFLAHEVATIPGADGLVSRDDDGTPSGLNYSGLIAPLVKAWQEHDERLVALRHRVEDLDATVARLEQKD